jgi:ribosomal-protein-alanine N-acetyltransferase
MIPLPIQLRAARPDDFAVLWEIDQICFSEEIAYTPAELRRSMKEPGAVTLVAETEPEEIAGFLVAARPRPHLGHVITIDVRPEFRSHGIGHTLMQALEGQFARTGVRRMRLEAAVNNLPALQFYKKLGYQVVRRLPRYYPGPIDGLLLEKDIAETGQAATPEAALR